MPTDANLRSTNFALRMFLPNFAVSKRPKTLITNYLKTLKAMKYVCDVCGYEYDPAVGDPDNGIAAGTAFADLPEDWVCPLCGVGKDQFSEA